jgi:hypothetical protein
MIGLSGRGIATNYQAVFQRIFHENRIVIVIDSIRWELVLLLTVHDCQNLANFPKIMKTSEHK